MKRAIWLSFSIIFFIPLVFIGFMFGGIDAIIGTEIHEKFYKLLEQLKYKITRIQKT